MPDWADRQKGAWRHLALCLFLLLVCPALTQAQPIGTVQSDILVLDTDRLFQETKYGIRLRERYEQKRAALIASNQKIEADLTAEEKALTEKRPQLTPPEFRALADAFDEKVQRIRSENERVAGDLERQREEAPVLFVRRVQPVLARLMLEHDAVVILEARTLLLRADAIDITDTAIAEVDAALGDGSDFDAEDDSQTGQPATDTGQNTGSRGAEPDVTPKDPTKETNTPTNETTKE